VGFLTPFFVYTGENLGRGFLTPFFGLFFCVYGREFRPWVFFGLFFVYTGENLGRRFFDPF